MPWVLFSAARRLHGREEANEGRQEACRDQAHTSSVASTSATFNP